MKVHNVFTCERLVEASNFQSNIGNIQQLFHSLKAPNFPGILSQGFFVTQDRRERFWWRALGRRELGNWNLFWFRRFDQREVFVPRRNARFADPTHMRCGAWQC